jgi:hypothetical protein
MLKSELIEFAKKFGFQKNWKTEDSMSLETDVHPYWSNKNPNSPYFSAFSDRLNLSFGKDSFGNDMFSISVTQFSTSNAMLSGRTLGYFNLKDFNETNQVLFLLGVASCFNEVPDSIKSYLRDRRLEEILNEHK